MTSPIQAFQGNIPVMIGGHTHLKSTVRMVAAGYDRYGRICLRMREGSSMAPYSSGSGANSRHSCSIDTGLSLIAIPKTPSEANEQQH